MRVSLPVTRLVLWSPWSSSLIMPLEISLVVVSRWDKTKLGSRGFSSGFLCGVDKNEENGFYCLVSNDLACHMLLLAHPTADG